MRTFLLIITSLLTVYYGSAQSLGGRSVYNFLQVPNTPQLTALGGINISQQTDDLGLAFHNPALLKPAMHTQANFVFNSFYSDIKNVHLQAAYYAEKLKTSFAGGVNYFNYGTVPETDIAGTRFGDFKPVDYVVQVTASRVYMERWQYGLTLKLIQSNYGTYRSTGIAMDFGVLYTDTARLLQVSLVAKNMGAQIKAYTGTSPDNLPFDLQLGISKRLAKAPLQFSLTAHHLHQFDITYRDTAFNNENGFDLNQGGKFSVDNVFRHVVLSVQLFITDKVEISAGYNHLRRKELSIGNAGNGLNGFSVGAGVLFKKIQLRYARSYYQNNTAFNQFGISVRLKDYLIRNKG